MIELLTWISIITGGILIVLMLLSLLGGLDLDFDLGGDVDTEVDSGGIGVVKGALTFFSIGSWVVKLVLVTESHPAFAFGIGLMAGIIAVFILNALLRLLLKNQANVNWSPFDAINKQGKVYLKIPSNSGNGIIQVTINGAVRELKAISSGKNEIPTGKEVFIENIENGFAVVSELS